MSFGEDFLKGFFGQDHLRDYTHGSKVFRTNGYELSPRKKFLFHVYFNVNTREIPGLRNLFGASSQENVLSYVVKSADLPGFTFDTEVKNQYNRKRVIQKKINYDPVRISFHDDTGDHVRNLWYNYYAYYYKDSNQAYWSPNVNNGILGEDGSGAGASRYSYNSRDIYTADRQVHDWGYVGESYSDLTTAVDPLQGGKPRFFQDITIFGFAQQKFAAYVLINPLISQFNHDSYRYEESGTMENTMTIQYETVKYYEGTINPTDTAGSVNVPGFASVDHYDRIRSDLYRPGTVDTILGPGGLIDGIGGIVSDLKSGSVAGVIGAVQKAGSLAETFKGGKLKSTAVKEAKDTLIAVGTGALVGALQPQPGANRQIAQTFDKSPTAGQAEGVGTGNPNNIPVTDLSVPNKPKAATESPVVAETTDLQTQSTNTDTGIFNNGEEYRDIPEFEAPTAGITYNQNQPVYVDAEDGGTPAQASPDTNARPNGELHQTFPVTIPTITPRPDTPQGEIVDFNNDGST